MERLPDMQRVPMASGLYKSMQFLYLGRKIRTGNASLPFPER
jgi:hypothetical protein